MQSTRWPGENSLMKSDKPMPPRILKSNRNPVLTTNPDGVSRASGLGESCLFYGGNC
jgi:hypothetical protein